MPNGNVNRQLNFFQHYLGVSRTSIILNAWIIGAGLFLLIRYVLIPLSEFVFDLLDFKHLAKQPSVFLEVSPPAFSLKKPQATEQFYSTLCTLLGGGSWIDRKLRRKSMVSFELPSSRGQGIRFVVKLPMGQVDVFQQQLSSYLPEVRFREIEDYLPAALGSGQAAGSASSAIVRVIDFKQIRHWAFPLAAHDSLTQHDPMAFIGGSMTQLFPGDLVVYQLVFSPARLREANKIYNKLLLGKDPNLNYRSWPWLIRLMAGIVCLPLLIVMGFVKVMEEIFHSSDSYSQKAYARSVAQRPEIQALRQSKMEKLAKPLFQVSLRALVITSDPEQARRNSDGIRSSLATFAVPGYQGFKLRRSFPFPRSLMNKYRLFSFRNRLPMPLTRQNCILSTSELASLYHFPYGDNARPENLVASHSKTLPAPASMKHNTDTGGFDVVLGENHHHGLTTPIGLTAIEREHHVYVIGGTGNGKTTMLEYGIVQDMRAGKGVAIIDPHGDSAQKLLKYVPEKRLGEVVYLNPRDLDYPIGLNLLELPEGLTGSELAHAKDQVAEAVISVLRKIFDDNAEGGAYRIERVLRIAIHTAFSIEGATLFTVLRLLTEANYRKQVVRNLTDQGLIRFWKEELGKAGEMQRVKISGGPITRIERFERSESAKRILGQVRSTIDFDDIVNSSKILICNFSKGRLGEDTSTLFGTTVLAKLQLAAWRREEIAEESRVPFYLYVDEFQNFASESFLALFSEARKYKLYLTMAQQSVSQLQVQTMANTILDNVGTIVAFRSKSEATERLLLHQFTPYVEPGEIGNLPSFNFYAKVAAAETQEPVSGETIVLDRADGDEEMVKRVVEESRERYGVEYKDTNSGKSEVVKPAQVVKTAMTEKTDNPETPEESLGDDLPMVDEPSPA